MVLEAIVAHKRAEIAGLKQRHVGLDPQSISPSRRSLETALKQPRTGYICECKKASPSKGLIRADFNPTQIAATYARYADAISVLTDAKFFQGSFDYLEAVQSAVDVPVLCKDIVVDPSQVIEARLRGADAVLLMLSVLDDEAYRACFQTAASLQLDALVEVHTQAELERALALDARIIGINNRNLNTLEIDLHTTEQLAPLVPGHKVIISESGIQTHADTLRLRHHVDAFLVGSSLMARNDLDRACRELIYGPVKVCGLTSTTDARTALESGAVYGGLIFAEGSPRRISLRGATELRDAVPLAWVGVFVDAELGTVVQTANTLGLAAVQLHGDESAEFVEELRERLPTECEIWKAHLVEHQPGEMELGRADRTLLDTAAANGARGGSGRTFDWSPLAERDLSTTIVAGGIGPDNVAQADQLGPFAIDVNSKVESAPGVKSPARLSQLFAKLRGSKENVR